jgi:hypothetical protein
MWGYLWAIRSDVFHFHDSTYFLASRRPSWKSDSVRHPYISLPFYNFILRGAMQILLLLYYICFWFDLLFKVTELKVRKKMTKLSWFVIVWCTMFLLCVNMYRGTLYPIPEFWSDRVSNMAARRPSWKFNYVPLLLSYQPDTCIIHILCNHVYGQYADVFFIFAILPIFWPPGGHLENQTILELTVVGRIVKFLGWVCLMKLHCILHRFLIWPTFQGHRGQSS